MQRKTEKEEDTVFGNQFARSNAVKRRSYVIGRMRKSDWKKLTQWIQEKPILDVATDMHGHVYLLKREMNRTKIPIASKVYDELAARAEKLGLTADELLDSIMLKKLEEMETTPA